VRTGPTPPTIGRQPNGQNSPWGPKKKKISVISHESLFLRLKLPAAAIPRGTHRTAKFSSSVLAGLPRGLGREFTVESPHFEKWPGETRESIHVLKSDGLGVSLVKRYYTCDGFGDGRHKSSQCSQNMKLNVFAPTTLAKVKLTLAGSVASY